MPVNHAAILPVTCGITLLAQFVSLAYFLKISLQVSALCGSEVRVSIMSTSLQCTAHGVQGSVVKCHQLVTC